MSNRVNQFYAVHRAIAKYPGSFSELGVPESIHHSELHALRRKIIKSLTKKEKMAINRDVRTDCNKMLSEFDIMNESAELMAVILIYAHGINSSAEKIGVSPTQVSRWVGGEFPILQVMRTIRILKDDCPED
jgi:hypothetical protein